VDKASIFFKKLGIKKPELINSFFNQIRVKRKNIFFK